MYVLSTLFALQQHIGLDATDSSEDARLLDALVAASAVIERRAQRSFQARVATIDHTIDLRNVTELLLTDDLLSLHSVTNGDGREIDVSDVVHASAGHLRLTNGEAFVYDDTPEDAIAVTGVWGYHPNYSVAWSDSGDTVQDASLSADATTISVTDADAGAVPRFQVGQLLRIDDEYLHLIAVDTDTNTLTVKRGVQGTTAAVHNNGASIEVYQVPADVAQLALRWALWLYREPDSFTQTLPAILLDSLDGLRRFTVRS